MTNQLDLSKTYRAILDAARNKRFISYGDLARANDADWQMVRYKMNNHLGELVKIAADRKWPMPTAIVVNQANIGNGTLDSPARDGFIKAAKECGFDVSSPATFVEEQQNAMFAWAETAPEELILPKEEKPTSKNMSSAESVRLFGPILDVLRSMGGSGEPKQVYENIVDSLDITNDILKETTKSGRPRFEKQVHWARYNLVKAGLIDSQERGVWKLTPEGRETHLDIAAANDLYRDIRKLSQYATEDDTDEADPPSEIQTSDPFDDENRRFWFVGAIWDGDDDQMERFIHDGIWQNGHVDKFSEHVARMQPGDRIAIKASFVKKYRLPFDNQDKPVACMRIKAIGTIVEATTDGSTVQVDWQPLDEPKEWYFYTYRVTVIEADASDEFARRLILFTFSEHMQDYEFWLRQPYWAKRYISPASTQTELELENEEDDADFEEAKITPYGVNDIIEDGCFLPQEALASALFSLTNKKSLILQGPPGTGKTWLAKRLGYALIGTKNRAVIRKRM